MSRSKGGFTETDLIHEKVSDISKLPSSSAYGINSTDLRFKSSVNGTITVTRSVKSNANGIVSDGCGDNAKALDSKTNEQWICIENLEYGESSQRSISQASTSSAVSDGTQSSANISAAVNKPHKGNDLRWEAIQAGGISTH
ncbi:hypothetical protein GOP47_0004095 [Adiantum capillus-veneris]|uniref:Uncharacterized protein n=1 Tax=Adiantum capillus-veneris TaxID=13818 RepID=A0A9D4V7H3_ADICA|nr:hypothetical protein GOP47_0004095 [Adiantum capillus-veneris]